eukprot:1120287-Prorocentrum_lima.AAC.1
MPMTSLPNTATGTSRAVVRLVVGDAQAVYWNDEVFCKECKTPLVPANKVFHNLGLILYTSGKKGTLWYQNGESSELLVNLKRRGELFYMTQSQLMLFRRAMGEKRRHPEC